MQDVFVGGIDIDSSSLPLEFTMTELMWKPRVMNKLRAKGTRSSTSKGHEIVSEDNLGCV
jgi:hypothetical protein